jgi:hypothetical protein
MSIGIGSYADLVLEDDELVIYEYGNYNLNEARFRNAEKLYDGLITIRKDCFVEPEIHEKVKKLPSGRKKLIVKKIPVSVDYPSMLEDGRIKFENCSNCWRIYKDIGADVMIGSLLFYIFLEYQETGTMPKIVTICK